MKKFLALLLALSMVLALAACGGSSDPATEAPKADAPAAEAPATEAPKPVKKQQLKWGSVHPETQVVTQMMMMAIEEINANAEGIEITGYPNGVLGGSSDMAEAIQAGGLDLLTDGPAQFAAWVPQTAQTEAPFLWQSVEHMQKALNGEYKDVLNEQLAQLDVQMLGTFYYGTRQLTTNKPISTLADLSGMKIRVPQAEMYVKMVESWGAAATPMNINDLYLALQTGTVDAQENPLTTYQSYKFYEVVKSVIMTNHIICPNMVFINQTVWESLSDHDKEVVQTAIDKAIKWQDEQILAAEVSLIEELKQFGVEFYEPDDTIREATIPYIKPLVEDWDYIQSLA